MAIDLKRVTEGKQQREPRVLIYGGDGVGKAQPLDATVLTPTGFVPMGEIEVGDLVIGGDGKPVAVTGVFPQGKKLVYRITMTDGVETECCDEHLWQTETVDGDRAVRPLHEIRETLLYREAGANPRMPNDYPNHRIPIVGAVEFVGPSNLPIHPYLLGALLGDGYFCGTSIEFSKPESDVLDKIASLLPETDTVTPMSDARVGDRQTGLRIRRRVMTAPRLPSSTFVYLRDLGLIGADSLTKFIPQAYLMASVPQRLELLHGLCDTDGSVARQRVEISTSSPQMRDGILFLVRSLGGTVTLRERTPHYTYKGVRHQGATAYRMLAYFPNGIVPVSSTKHTAKWRREQKPYYRSIESIEPVGEKECQCIRVEAADGLYVTDYFIVTHNTRFAAGAPDPFFLDVNRGSLSYDVKRVVPESWSETMEWISAVETGQVKCKTLVIDSISDLEHMGHTEFFQNTTIDKWDGGYGRGESYALMRWRELVNALERVWKTGKAIVLVGHMQVKRFEDPSGPGYERYEVAARSKLAGLLRQNVDYVLFANLEVAQQKVGGETKFVTSGVRWVHTQRCPAFDAKARCITFFPEKVLLSWDEFSKARAADGARVEEMKREIDAMLVEIGDKKLDEIVRDYMRKYPDMVVEARNRVAARLEETRAAAKPVAQQPAA